MLHLFLLEFMVITIVRWCSNLITCKTWKYPKMLRIIHCYFQLFSPTLSHYLFNKYQGFLSAYLYSIFWKTANMVSAESRMPSGTNGDALEFPSLPLV